MKKRIISLCLAIMMAGSAFGCGKSQVPSPQPSSENETITSDESTSENTEASSATEKEDEKQADNTNEEISQEEIEKAKDAQEDAGQSAVTTGGTPWIDSEIKENITADMPTDPKDDFNLYANKDWILSNEIPAGYNAWSHYSECEIEVKKRCMELLKDESIEGHDAEVVRAYNKLLLDWEARDKAGYSDIQNEYEKVLNAKTIDDITGLLTGKDTILEYFSFIGYGADTSLNDPETYLVCVSTPKLLLGDSAEYSNRTEIGDIYYNAKKEQFSYMEQKLGMSAEEADKYYEAAIDFESKLAQKIYTTADRYASDYYDKINNELSLEELVSLSKDYPLEKRLTVAGYKYDGKYFVSSPDYFKLLGELYTQDNIEGIKATMLVHYLLDYIRKLDRDTYDKANEISNKYFGSSGTVSDEEYAYENVVKDLPACMQKVYIARYGSAEDKEKMRSLCQDVIDTYREMLSENTWASEEVKKNAIEKLDKMTIHAAYPDKFRDTKSIDLTDCSLIDADRRILECEYDYNKSLIGKKRDKEMWAEGFNILECNAFYSPSENTINMIIGMMGEPFYSSDMSIEELYASIGAFWVGHEISHAFDSNGSQFDAEGKYRDWWTEEDKKEFDRRIKKMDDYLDTIVAFGDYHFIGSSIDTEMVADMTGLQCALKMASKVENFDYEKFFTKYAQMNGSLALYSLELSQLLQDAHPLSYSRTNVPIQQFEEFYETFDVKEGDNMYLAPEDRLTVW